MPVDIEKREYRSMSAVQVVQADAQAGGADYTVRGYATTYDDPYLLYESDYDGTKLFETIAAGAIDESTDTSDVIMQFDHEGRVFARTGNGTLSIDPSDPHGLAVEADLSSTTNTRSLYEDIKAGLITKMSWAFTVDRESYTRDSMANTELRTIQHIKKIYDVSAVSLPANEGTEIASARSLYDGVIKERQRESLQRKEEDDRRRRRIALMLSL